ncbi:hypothetical protein Hanom_Chr17g01590221 [Helianthus anomalus]
MSIVGFTSEPPLLTPLQRTSLPPPAVVNFGGFTAAVDHRSFSLGHLSRLIDSPSQISFLSSSLSLSLSLSAYRRHAPPT